MSPSSASSERNFSTLAFIHSKLRNRLGPEKVGWLAYIKTNFAQAGGYGRGMTWVEEEKEADDADDVDVVDLSENVEEGDGVFGEEYDAGVEGVTEAMRKTMTMMSSYLVV